MTVTRVLALVVGVMAVALLVDPLTTAPTVLYLAGVAWFIGAGAMTRRAANDRAVATVERHRIEERIHDVNTMNAYHHRRNVR